MQWWKQQTPTPAPTPAAKPPAKPAEQAPNPQPARNPQPAPTPPPVETEFEPSVEPQVEASDPSPAREAERREPREADRPQPRTADRPQARTAVVGPPPRPAAADDDDRSVGEAIDEAIGDFERTLAEMKDQANEKRIELADLERDIKRLEKEQAKSLKQMLGSNPAIRKMLNPKPKRKSPRGSRKTTQAKPDSGASESESVFES